MHDDQEVRSTCAWTLVGVKVRHTAPVTMRSCDDLTLTEKCQALGGASTWRTHAIDRVGIPALKMSDGPNGVRGDGLGATMVAGVVMPVGIALGATWDPALVAEVGSVIGTEAVRRGVHVLLAPTVNLHRTPIGGRVFECYSEDPELTARLAVEFVRGVQAHDVAVTVKHFCLNDTEIDRMTVDVAINDRALRELYLRPFEAAVTEGKAWGIMSSYNKYAGEQAAQSHTLLTKILRDQWGFDGFVVSDWFGAHDTVGSALGGLTIPMPGPRTIYGEQLQRAVEAGAVPEERVDELVEELFRLIDRTKADERSSERVEQSVDDPADREVARRAAAGGQVLLRNDGTLPLVADLTVALVGPNASDTRIMGGGSSSLQSLPTSSILAALSARRTVVTHEPGVRIDRLAPPATASMLRTPDGKPGLRVDYRNGRDTTGPIVTTEITRSTQLRFFGSTPQGVDPNSFNVVVSGSFVAPKTGTYDLSGVLTGAGHITIGGVGVVEDPDRKLPRGPMFFGFGCEEQLGTLDAVEGESYPVGIVALGAGGFAGIRLGVRQPDPDDLFDRAVQAAAAADVAIVVVGTNDEWETEGEDRTTIALPGEQDDLVRAVAAVNPRTVVVVNAGAPVAMPWADDVAAIVLAYFGGYEMANAIVDVLQGDVDPGGRLPITYPVELQDTPAWEHYEPVNGIQHYLEGLEMGYRGFDNKGVVPLFPFGHGLSYGESTWAAPSVDQTSVAPGTDVTVSVRVTVDGDRDSTEVVQVYVARPDAGTTSPPKALAAWTKAVLVAGSTQAVTVAVPATAFRRWDVDSAAWVTDAGRYELIVAASAGDERFRLGIDVTATL
jgi:beta-glucosidase